MTDELVCMLSVDHSILNIGSALAVSVGWGLPLFGEEGYCTDWTRRLTGAALK